MQFARNRCQTATVQPLPVTAPPPTRRPVIVWDLVLTIVLLVVLVGLTAVLFFLSFFLAFAGDSCGAVECNYDVMGVGFVVAMFGPPIVALLALVTIATTRRRAPTPRGRWGPPGRGAVARQCLTRR